MVFGIGPAGTGKTYLAVAKAVQALQAKQVNRIILTRPAVEAGEHLGFLPGTLNDKIDPYLRPLYDALHDMLDPDSIPRLLTAGTIEVAPLAYMRGRAQPVDAPILTPSGYRPIGRLRVGDLVVGSDGRPTPVLGVYPQGQKPIYRVTTQDGGVDRGLRGTPVARQHPGGPTARQGRPSAADAGHGGQPAPRAHPPLRVAAGRPGRDAGARGADRSVRAWPAAGRRMPDHIDHALVCNR